MTDLSVRKKLAPYKATNKVRFVTAASLFDGHDASINIMRRILQASGAEVIHLGHNRSVADVVKAALEEDVQGISISSYQGGHIEYFKYMLDLLRENGGGEIKVFGGGGGVIVPSEIEELHRYGVARIYSPEDGATLGLQGMINDVLQKADFDLTAAAPGEDAAIGALASGDRRKLARVITALENGAYGAGLRNRKSFPCSASPARAARERARSPTSWCCGCAWTSRTASRSRSCPSIRRASAPAARCWATASA
jgi:isobutyryl-CoA mutase